MLAASILVMICSCHSSNSNSTIISDEPVIISINTGSVGYFTDADGSLLFGKQFEAVDAFSEGLAAVKSNGKCGYIDTLGQMVIPCIYDGARVFNEGLAAVISNGKCGYIDKQGQMVIPCTYDGAEAFNKGLAAVKSNDKYGVIDKDGKYIIQPIAPDISYIKW